jgi:Response regulator containing CheY-like receiver, AAA-type ATPase, and DNA-binding domains
MIPGQDPLPRLLLVEDDPISQRFLLATLESLPATVDAVASVAEAMQLATETRYDLWLVDAYLPDGSGGDLLRQLRRRWPCVPALAHTADGTAGMRESLRRAGFGETLVKPMTADALLKAVRRALARGADDHPPPAGQPALGDWDETAALAALNGQRTHLVALRELFLAELPVTHEAVVAALQRQDEAALRGQLHRLQASCGFVGAARLGRAVRELHHHPGSMQARNQFSEAVAALLH